MDRVSVRAGDGRNLEVLAAGPTAGAALVFHGGTPGAAVAYPPLSQIAAQHGLRLVMYSRPGYATSDPQPGRTVACAGQDVAAILDALEIGEFVTAGWSGGGPHALACAALLPDRCLAAATIAGVAPRTAAGLDWLAGMGPENVEEFQAAFDGSAALTAWMTPAADGLAAIAAADVTAALGGLVSPVDVASLTGAFADWSAAKLRLAVSTGIAGWRDDDLAFTHAWGFDLDAMAVPVCVWQGGADRMVPAAHGAWLAGAIRGAMFEPRPIEGHLSLLVHGLGEIIGRLCP